jgi:hypothetical protein
MYKRDEISNSSVTFVEMSEMLIKKNVKKSYNLDKLKT